MRLPPIPAPGTVGQHSLGIWMAGAILAAVVSAAQTPAAAGRPNILWVVSEDNAAYTVGAYEGSTAPGIPSIPFLRGRDPC